MKIVEKNGTSIVHLDANDTISCAELSDRNIEKFYRGAYKVLAKRCGRGHTLIGIGSESEFVLFVNQNNQGRAWRVVI